MKLYQEWAIKKKSGNTLLFFIITLYFVVNYIKIWVLLIYTKFIIRSVLWE